MEVRIRTEWDDTAQTLGEVPFEQAPLDKIIPLLTRWGVVDIEGNTYDCTNEMSGQFKVTPAGAYFEVILTASDDS